MAYKFIALRRPLAGQILAQCGRPGVPIYCRTLKDNQLRMGAYVSLHKNETVARSREPALQTPSIRFAYDNFITKKTVFKVGLSGRGVTRTSKLLELLPRQQTSPHAVVERGGEVGTVDFASDLPTSGGVVSVTLTVPANSEVRLDEHTYPLPLPVRPGVCGCCGQ